MMPSCDQTGVPIHFHSSTTSGSASLMRLRILPRVSPRQSPSSAILFEMRSDAGWPWLAPDSFMFFCQGASAQVTAAEAVVQAQFDAYNARNMDLFLATYADDAELFGFPASLQTKGKEEMRKRYTSRFADPILLGKIVQRIVLGNV